MDASCRAEPLSLTAHEAPSTFAVWIPAGSTLAQAFRRSKFFWYHKLCIVTVKLMSVMSDTDT